MATREETEPVTEPAEEQPAQVDGSAAKPPLMRVHKGLGAVAVYKPGRALALVLAAVVAVLAAGFGIGRATDSDTTTKAAAPSAETVRAARASGFESGFRSGVVRGRAQAPAPKPAPKPAKAPKPAPPAAVAGAGALQAGVPYIVKVARECGRTQIVRQVQMDRGATYWVCPNDGNICTRAGG